MEDQNSSALRVGASNCRRIARALTALATLTLLVSIGLGAALGWRQYAFTRYVSQLDHDEPTVRRGAALALFEMDGPTERVRDALANAYARNGDRGILCFLVIVSDADARIRLISEHLVNSAMRSLESWRPGGGPMRVSAGEVIEIPLEVDQLEVKTDDGILAAWLDLDSPVLGNQVRLRNPNRRWLSRSQRAVTGYSGPWSLFARVRPDAPPGRHPLVLRTAVRLGDPRDARNVDLPAALVERLTIQLPDLEVLPR